MAGQDPTQTPSVATVPTDIGTQYPATQSMQLPNLLRTIQALSGSFGSGQAANVPYLPQTQISPNMPVAPQMVPMQQMQQMPTGQGATLQDRRTVNAQNWGSMLGNAIGMVANKKMQENYQKNVKTISDATNYLQAIKNAQMLKQMYPNNPEIQKMTDAAIAQNQSGFQNLTSDPKISKMIGKALSWDFTDPKHMQSEEVKAGQAGIKLATDQNRTGINAITPQDKQIQDMLDKGQQAAKGVGAIGQGLSQGVMTGAPQGAASTPTQPYQQPSSAVGQAQALQRTAGSPFMAPGQMTGSPPAMGAGGQQVRPQNRMEQYLATRPTGFIENPAYEAQQKFDQAVALAVLRNVAPAETRKEATLGAAELHKEATLGAAEVRAQTQTNVEASRAATAKYKVDKETATRLEITAQNNDRALEQYNIRYGSLTELLKGNPGAARGIGVAASAVGGKIDKDIQSLGTAINNRQKQITTLQNQLDFGQPIMETGLFDKTPKQKYDSKGKPMFGPLSEGPEREKIKKAISLLNAQNDTDNQHVTSLQTSRDKFTSLSDVAADTTAASASVGQYSGKASMAATDYDPKGGFQQWMPQTEQIRQQVAPNVPPPLAAAILMSENARGNPYADPDPGKGGQGLWQMTRENQKKYGVTNAFDPANITAGAMRMLGQSIQDHNGDIRKVIEDWAPKPKDASGKPQLDAAYVEKVFNLYKQIAGTTTAEATQQPSAAPTSTLTPTPAQVSTQPAAAIQPPPVAKTEQDVINKLGNM